MASKKPPDSGSRFNSPFAKLSLPAAKASTTPGASTKATAARLGPAGSTAAARKAALKATPQSPPTSAPATVAPRPDAKAIKRTRQEEEDQRVFEQAMRGVVPLSEAQRARRVAPTSTSPPVTAARLAKAATEDALARADLTDLVQVQGAFVIEEVGESVAATAPGIDRRLLRRLRGGDFPVEAELDLHRRTRAEAAAELERFLARARAAGQRAVLVIVGRGLGSGPEGPVLPSATRTWLTEHAMRRHVLAFVSAPPEQGGTGALLLLLRQARSSERP